MMQEADVSQNLPLKILDSIAACRAWRQSQPADHTVALVPTMGALHDGHASLVRAARQQAGPNAAIIASIFVNPTQFGPNEDFTRYPRTFEADCRVLAAAGCLAVFAPSAADMYPAKTDQPAAGGQTAAGPTVDPGPLGSVLEGAIRPGHFRGVCTVVLKLLNIVQPHLLFMGQKDYQQNAVLMSMVSALNVPTKLIIAPTRREPDGLAMSSRNRYLDPAQRAQAGVLYQAQMWAKAEFEAGLNDAKALAAGMRERIAAGGLIVQYAEVADARTLETLSGPVKTDAVLLVAAQLGATRLIDNMLLNWKLPGV